MKWVDIKLIAVEKTLHAMKATQPGGIHSVERAPTFHKLFQGSIQTAVYENVLTPLRLDLHSQEALDEFIYIDHLTW